MRKFLLSLLVMLMAGMDYAMAATFPALSTPDKPVLYYIRNTRQDKFVSLGSTTDFLDEIPGTEKSQSCMFWFESAGDLINGTYQPVYIHNLTTAKSLGRYNSWNAKGAKWFIRENTVNSEYLGIGAVAGEEGNGNVWWNDNGGTKVKSWQLNGDQGSIWDIIPVPEEEIPAGLSVITWNLGKGDNVLLSVKSVAVQGVQYEAPFDIVSYAGSTTATGNGNNQTVDVPYAENFKFTASESLADAIWYKAILRGNKYLHYDNPEVSCSTANESKNDMGSYFAFVGDAANGFRIYNAALSKGNALGGDIFARLKAVPEEEAPTFMLENNNGIYVFRNLGSGIGYLNDNNSYLAYWMDNNASTDGGSSWTFEQVDAELNARINNAGTITYKFFKDGNEVGTQSMRAMGGEPLPEVPIVIPGYYGETPKGVVKGDATFDIELKPAIPASTNYASATWFRLVNKPNGTDDRYLCYQEGAEKYEMTQKAGNNDNYLWALIGSPEEGYLIMNKAAGDGMYLSVEPGNGNFPTMTTTPQVWDFALQSNNSNNIFGLGVNGFWINNFANNHFLSLWQSGPSGDVGSTLKIVEVDIINGMYIDTEGFMEIASAEDYLNFAKYVADGNVFANAALVEDIDLGTDGTMIGGDGKDFQGTFDGRGHTITINSTATADGQAIFRNLGSKALVQNLKVQGTITTDKKYAAGIAAWSSGNIRGCYVDLTVQSSISGDATHGGIAGVAYRGTVIENCLVKFTVNGASTQNCGGLVGWASDKINIANCLVINDGSTFDLSNNGSANISRNNGNVNTVNLSSYNSDIYGNRPAGASSNNYATSQWGDNNATTVVPFADLADGRICYQLNTDQSSTNWVQQIGTDAYPVPAAFGSGKVFASVATGCNGKAEGEVTFSNSGSAQATAHKFDKYGICSVCGCFNFNFEFDHKDRAILLKSADDIFRAEGWNRIGDGFKLNMKMANDITCVSEPGQNIFNTSNWVEGDFDGDGHTLTIEMTEMGSNASFLPEFAGTFKNVIMHGTIATSGQYAGSVTSHTRNNSVVIKNVYSDININTTHTGDNTTGGFIGVGETAYKVENSIYNGNIAGVEGTECIAGICGWSSGNGTLVNVAFLGNLVNAGGDSKLISRNPNNITPNNSYFLNDCGLSDDRFTQVNAEDITSGKLAFLLNGSKQGGENFYQLIGTDATPLPFAKDGAKVYTNAESYSCDGTPQGDIQYVNEEIVPELPAHEYEGGICKNCGNLETDADGYQKIINANTLVQFANLVNGGKNDLNARLYNDIDLTGVEYTPVGTTSSIFVGEFDGQNHVVSNLVIDNGNVYQGLIGVIGNGAEIKNVTLDETCSISCNHFAGVVGGTNGSGVIYITNVANQGNVTCTNQNASGILGVDMNGSMALNITNCYVTGTIKGGNESAAITSWSNEASVIDNCWSIATVEGVDGTNTFSRGGTQVKNCYEIEGQGKQGNTIKIPAEDVTNGALCYTFNQNAGEELLGQNLNAGDAYPTFASNLSVMYDAKNDVYYNPLQIADVVFENAENAGVKGTFGFNKTVTAVTDNGVALIMEKDDFDANGIYGGKHLFGAVSKNGNITLDNGKVVIDFTSFSGHTDQPIFAGDLARADVGDVKADAKYVAIIIGGTVEVDGDVFKDNLVYYCDGAELLSLLDQAVEKAYAEDPTAIKGITTDENAEVYSITGVRVNKAQKGVYIINGKKVANK